MAIDPVTLDKLEWINNETKLNHANLTNGINDNLDILAAKTNEVIDEVNKPDMISVTYAELGDLKDEGKLIPGRQYRITDYVTTVSRFGAGDGSIITTSAGHSFDIIVTADDEYQLNENARVARSANNPYFANSNLAAWEIKYCFYNDTTRFAWADPISGKGVIYWMKDEWNNILPYDFKNILYNGRYTFSNSEGGYGQADNDIDMSLEETDDNYSNEMKERYDNNGRLLLNYNIFIGQRHYGNKFGLGCYYNTLGNGCYYNTFGNDCYRNTFDSNCYRNTFGDYCYRNTFAKECYRNTFGIGCCSNTFGIGCYANTFKENCDSNIFGIGCYNNTFEDKCRRNKFGLNCCFNTFGGECYDNTFIPRCRRNTFGTLCYSNTFGDECYNNTFGNNCYDNTFGTLCYSNTFGVNCYSNIFDSNCSYNVFDCDCYRNTFGNQCRCNNFGNGCSDNSLLSGCARNTFNFENDYNELAGGSICNIFDDAIRYVTLTSDSSYTYPYYIQGVHLHSGIQGPSAYNRKTITVERRTKIDYSIDIYAANSRTVTLND